MANQSVIDQLKQIFRHNVIIEAETDATTDVDAFEWFQFKGEWIGVRKVAMTTKERQLLTLFLDLEHVDERSLSSHQKPWHQLLFTTNPPAEELPSYRLLHFHMKEALLDRNAFEEAIIGLYPYEPVLLWETLHRGVLVEPQNAQLEEAIAYEDLAEALTGDFYTDVHLYVGQIAEAGLRSPISYRLEKESFDLTRTLNTKAHVFTHSHQLPLFLLSHSSPEAREELQLLLSDIRDDKELMDSIRTFLECNMNITTASKALFIHRNSLQYRVDKFIERTQLDVKSFSQAVTVYLAMLAIDF
ncbi:PucR family transcriptional regulator [Aureibacillus halotolerans]|uniref:PucR-like helix-turn-helix protein n=1 Tax=Aureibacillus halotolerans TaxID=1508390 RepID=A0A4R6UCM7_9BACI|nr:helix-turn-helix domain-containing protein [Aureibacillus halotolerans]TDQ42789.1 PucR-like helix-turn-helix protein [Aureibacillus halotolerans]